MGKKSNYTHVGKCFHLTQNEQKKKMFHLKYSCVTDQYVRVSNDKEVLKGWENGTFLEENIQRSETSEEAFLSRNSTSSAEESASISWKFDFGKFKMDFGALRAISGTFSDNASVTWKIYDGANTNRYIFPTGDGTPFSLHKLNGASSLVLSAFLRGGEGKNAWSRTRLFQQPKSATKDFPCPLEIWARLRPGEDIEKWEKPKGKSFTLTKKERDNTEFHLKYTSGENKYIRVSNDNEVIDGWEHGIYAAENVVRNEEKDDNVTYLSRLSGQTPDDSSFITWKFDFGGYQLESGSLLAWSTTHHDSATVLWKVQDSMNPHRFITPTGATEAINLDEFKGSSSLVLSVFICGGSGEHGKAWQHAQLFRQKRGECDVFPFDIKLKLTKAVTIFDKIEEMSIAAMNNDMDYLKEVLNCVRSEYGVSELSIIHTNSQGDTPLHAAMKFDSVDVTVCLIETFPALLNMTNRENKLPIDYASHKMKSAIKASGHGGILMQEEVPNKKEESGLQLEDGKAGAQQEIAQVNDQFREWSKLGHPEKSAEANGAIGRTKKSVKEDAVKRTEGVKSTAEKEKLRTVKSQSVSSGGERGTAHSAKGRVDREKARTVKSSGEKEKVQGVKGSGDRAQSAKGSSERDRAQSHKGSASREKQHAARDGSEKQKVRTANAKETLHSDRRRSETAVGNATDAKTVKSKGKPEESKSREGSRTSAKPAGNSEKIVRLKRKSTDGDTGDRSVRGAEVVDGHDEMKQKKRKSIEPSVVTTKPVSERRKKKGLTAVSVRLERVDRNTVPSAANDERIEEQASNDTRKKPEKLTKRKRKFDSEDDILDDEEVEKLRQERNFQPGDIVAVNGEGLDDDAYWIGKIRKIEGAVVNIHWYDKDTKGRYKPQFLKANNKAYLDTIAEDAIMERVKLVKGKVFLK